MAVDMKLISQVAAILVIVGAINWGLEAVNMNLVQGLVGKAGTAKSKTALERLVYLLVGAAGVFAAYELVQKK